MKQCQKGTFFVFLSAVLYSIGGLLIKLIPWNGISINGARSVIALVVIGGYLVVTGRRIYLNRWVFFGAVAVLCTSLFFCIATKLTTAANAIVLQFTAPVLVILISWFVLKKKPTKLDLITCFAVFSGVICFFLDSLSAGGTLGNCMALVSGLGYAGVFFLNKLLGDDSVLAVFWGTVFSVVIGIPYIINEEAFSLSIMGSLVMLGYSRQVWPFYAW
ncbi:DMT family transporter [Bengtsoniella intestinalis]|uniref:DMT family transporter n=1 Tax=Bengtsoniella intestinalis TaxID=3073143 RepID=UPI00391F1D52